MKKLILYGTSGCHLCEQAAELLAYVLDESEYEIVEVDIADADELMSRYAEKIPVLVQSDISTELYWPFDEAALESFLTQQD